MMKIEYRAIRFFLSVILLLVLALSGTGIAFADSTTATATVTAGTLIEMTATPPIPRLTVDGTAQAATYTLAITLTDATGFGSGWNLTITSTTFSTGGTTPYTLSNTASSLIGVTAVCLAGITCTNPTNSLTYPLTIPAGTITPTAMKFFNATANTGLGKFTITPTISVALPANMYPGTYSSTITLGIVSGP